MQLESVYFLHNQTESQLLVRHQPASSGETDVEPVQIIPQKNLNRLLFIQEKHILVEKKVLGKESLIKKRLNSALPDVSE